MWFLARLRVRLRFRLWRSAGFGAIRLFLDDIRRQHRFGRTLLGTVRRRPDGRRNPAPALASPLERFCPSPGVGHQSGLRTRPWALLWLWGGFNLIVRGKLGEFSGSVAVLMPFTGWFGVGKPLAQAALGGILKMAVVNGWARVLRGIDTHEHFRDPFMSPPGNAEIE